MSVNTEKVRVLIAGFSNMLSEGIRYTLPQDNSIVVIGEASGTDETLKKIESDRPDLLILNTDNRSFPGIDISRNISSRFPGIKVILIQDDQSEGNILAAIKSGAKACLNSYSDQDTFQKTVYQVIQGKSPVTQYLLVPGVSGEILDELKASKTLLDIEEKILAMISDGNLLKEITESLHITESELADSLDNILKKLIRIEYPDREQKSYNVAAGPSVESTGKSAGAEKPPESSDSTSQTPPRESPQTATPDDVTSERAEKPDNRTGPFNLAAENITEIIKLAREAERLSAFQDINQRVVNIIEALNDEIDHRHRIVRRIKKAIDEEIVFGENIERIWSEFNKKK